MGKLTGQHRRCLQTADGNALTLVQSHAGIDLLITDVALPGLNGFDMTGPDRRIEMLPRPFGVNQLPRAAHGLLPP